MNSKEILSKVLYSLVSGDSTSASSFMSKYIQSKSAKVLKEMDFGEKFNTTVDLKNKPLRLSVDGIKVDLTITGTQEAAYRQEHVGAGYPSYDEIYLYGTVHLTSIDSIALNGVEVVENITSFADSTADSLLAELKQAGLDIQEIIDTGAKEKGVPTEVYGELSQDFGIKLIQALAKSLRDMEGQA